MTLLNASIDYLPISDPTWIFFVVLSIILFAPMLLERLRIPAIVGMIFAGVLIGPHGFNILERDGSFELFGKVGLYYIMFLASLEMNLQDVHTPAGREAAGVLVEEWKETREIMDKLLETRE